MEPVSPHRVGIERTEAGLAGGIGAGQLATIRLWLGCHRGGGKRQGDTPGIHLRKKEALLPCFSLHLCLKRCGENSGKQHLGEDGNDEGTGAGSAGRALCVVTHSPAFTNLVLVLGRAMKGFPQMWSHRWASPGHSQGVPEVFIAAGESAVPTGHSLCLLFVGTWSDRQNYVCCHIHAAQLPRHATSQDSQGTVSGHSHRLSFCTALLPAAKADHFTQSLLPCHENKYQDNKRLWCACRAVPQLQLWLGSFLSGFVSIEDGSSW